MRRALSGEAIKNSNPGRNQEDQHGAGHRLKGDAQKRRVHLPASNPPDEHELDRHEQRQDFLFRQVFEILGHRISSDALR
jgi:hypothetical protein